jgi:hypothetical protein
MYRRSVLTFFCLFFPHFFCPRQARPHTAHACIVALSRHVSLRGTHNVLRGNVRRSAYPHAPRYSVYSLLALLVKVQILTQKALPGATFASRVAASLLRALFAKGGGEGESRSGEGGGRSARSDSLPATVVFTEEEFVAVGVRLGRGPAELRVGQATSPHTLVA